uniref:Uncharacterized protein n=1 Tax=Gopherus agassizii TaxID=38772 RepID=A0A452GJ14_9SAUR
MPGKSFFVHPSSAKSLEELSFLMQIEQYLEDVPEEIERYILDGKPKTAIEVRETGAKWVEVAEKKKTTSSWSEYQRGYKPTMLH